MPLVAFTSRTHLKTPSVVVVQRARSSFSPGLPVSARAQGCAVFRLAPLNDGGVLGRPASVVTESAEQEGRHDHSEQDDQKPINAFLGKVDRARSPGRSGATGWCGDACPRAY